MRPTGSGPANLRAIRTVQGPVAGAMAILEIAKRIGLARPCVRAAIRCMFSRRLMERAFAGYAPHPSDVFVATFAKSGTNWMMQIALQIAWRGEAEFDHIHQLVPWPESPGPGPVGLRDETARDASPTGMRVIKTHLPPAFVPYDPRATYLTVIRDPKEVVISAYHFLGGILNVSSHVDIDSWYELFTEAGMIREWAAHTAGFWSWRERPNVLVVGYEELARELRRNVLRIAQKMGVRLDETQLARVVDRASFPYMKAHESQFAPPRSPFARSQPPTRMIRSGPRGANDETLSPLQQGAVDRQAQQELARLGSDFPYAARFGARRD